MQPILDASSLIRGSTGPAFPSFPKLPPELRLKIWNFALEEGRIVPLYWAGGDGDGPEQWPRGGPSDRRRRRRGVAGCITTAQPPALLHACHESRREALRRYRPSFGAASLPGQVPFDPERDLPFFGPRNGYMASDSQFRTVLSLTPPAELRLIRRLALSEALLWVDITSPAPAAATGCVLAPCFEPPLDHAACSARELLGLVRARLPACRELVFVTHDESPVHAHGAAPVPDRAAATAAAAAALALEAGPHRRLGLQLRSALEDVSAMFPGWDPPRVSIASLTSAKLAPALPRARPAGQAGGRGESGRKRQKRQHHHHACARGMLHSQPAQQPERPSAGCRCDGMSKIDIIHQSAVVKFQQLREAAMVRMAQDACQGASTLAVYEGYVL